MIPSINNNQITFQNYTPKLSRGTKVLDKFLQSQENLSHTRFIQGTLTNWFPKAVLSRSVIDFSEFTFLEFIESGIFYFAAPFFGEKLFRNKLFKKFQPKNLQDTVVKNLSNSVNEVKKSHLDKELKKRIITTKGGILLALVTVPAMEYALGFTKNLFTLKVFKVSDFNNVANLNKNKSEDLERHKKVEKHSKDVLLKTGILSALSIVSGIALSVFGHKSKYLTNFSKVLLEPGKYISKTLQKFGVNSKKTDKFLNEYLKLDFDNQGGKLALSKGQLAATCITGLFGYSAAAKDRGKLDVYEVWTRVPLVVLYTIFGSSLLDGSFKKYLLQKNKYPELIKRDSNGEILNVPSRKQLPQIAKELAEKNKTNIDSELSKLIKQKSVITGVPYLFSLVAMGFTLSGISRLWTQYRYNKIHKNDNVNNVNSVQSWETINSTAFEGFKLKK